MRTVTKKFAFLILLVSFAQSAFAIEHEYSEQHLNDCEHSICINPVFLDDSLNSATYEFKQRKITFAISIALCHQTAKQPFQLASPSRAPPL